MGRHVRYAVQVYFLNLKGVGTRPFALCWLCRLVASLGAMGIVERSARGSAERIALCPEKGGVLAVDIDKCHARSALKSVEYIAFCPVRGGMRWVLS